MKRRRRGKICVVRGFDSSFPCLRASHWVPCLSWTLRRMKKRIGKE